jgi:DNA primase
MYQSRQAIGKKDECYLVEGYTDVISLHQGGVENVVASSGTSLTEDQLRLISQLTKNLTILYDGDAAGIKAALRGLDMALSQSFNVQLVLLPDGEDPDSFIQKSGAAAFDAYVKEHKQGVISFRLEIGMKEVGDDPIKKSKLVNEIAESISRINKAEDFALQQHYVREAANKLKVEEAGLLNLINKFIRERIEADNKQRPTRPDAPTPEPEVVVPADVLPKTTNKEAEQEWQLLRVLIEHGHEDYNETHSVAAHIIETVDVDMLEQPLVKQLVQEYLDHWQQFGRIPELHYFINHPDPAVQQRMASVLHHSQDISPKWKDRTGIEPLSPRLTFLNDVDSTLVYYQLKKLMYVQQVLLNEKLKETDDPLKQDVILRKYMELKAMEKDLLKKHGTVVFKSSKIK